MTNINRQVFGANISYQDLNSDALKLMHERGAKLPISEATIQKLHNLSRGEIWDAGAYKERVMSLNEG